MGNQPSAPAPPAPPAPPPPPPLPPPPPPCDMDCQKAKNLALLKSALDTATENQDQNPQGYESARIAYYTLLNGQGWLTSEKDRIAREEVQPILSSYNSTYTALKGETQSQKAFMSLANNLKAQEAGDKESNTFLQKQINEEKDKADVLDRLNSFHTPAASFSYIPIIIDILIVGIMIGCLYLGYTKFDRIRNFFASTPSIDGSIT